MASGLVVFASWVAGGGPALVRVEGLPPMLPVTALFMILCGLGVAGMSAYERRWRLVARWASVLAILGVVLVQAGWLDFALLEGFVQRIYPDQPAIPPPHVLVTVLLIALGTLSAGVRLPGVPPLTDIFGTLALAFSYFGLLAYVARAMELFEMTGTGMAFSTAVVATALSLGVLGARPHGALATLATVRDPGGTLVRRLLPAALGLPLVAAVIQFEAVQIGLVGAEGSFASLMMTTAIVAGGLVLWAGRDLSREATERRAQAEAVARSEATLRAILDAATDAIFVKDRFGRYILCNEAAARNLGLRVEEVVGRTDFEIFPRESAALLVRNDRDVMHTGVAHTVEEAIRLPDGSQRTYLSVKAPFGLAGQIEGTVGFTRDISERKQAEEEVRASEARFRALLEADPDAVFITGEDGKILLANRRADGILGGPREQLVGRSLESFLLPSSGEAWRNAWRGLTREETREGETPAPLFEAGALRLDGTSFDAEFSLGVVFEEGAPLVITILRDITERKRLQAELVRQEAQARAARESAQVKDAFLSSLSHEIKTPISLIIGYAELMQDRCAEEELINGLLDGTRRLVRHVDDLLTYSALIGNSLPLYRMELSVAEVVEDAIRSVEPEARARKVQLAVRLPPEPVLVDGDPRRLVQAIQALLENAVRYSPEASGVVEIEGRQAGNSFDLAINDNGPGMSEADLRLAWEPFGKVLESGPGWSGGLGLGLKIARGLVEMHGGQLGILSRPGFGTTATVKLPAIGLEPPGSELPASEPTRTIAPGPDERPPVG